MMGETVIQINLGNSGSTGTIMYGIAETARKHNYLAYCVYPALRLNKPLREYDIIIESDTINRLSQRLSRIFGVTGCYSFFSTLILISKMKKINPHIIHLHNLHNSYINLPLLFGYIKRSKIKTVWTLHDCWAFTGRCPYFQLYACNKWKTECKKCVYPQNSYPPSLFDLSRINFLLKKKWFLGVPDMTLVTPSEWLSDLVKQSFLKEYPLIVINNGIDLGVFHPYKSTNEKLINCRDKIIILGVAFDWGIRKGLDVFKKLSMVLSDKYQIVLVGTNDRIDAELPENIITIHRTQDQNELAELYSSADVFVNPTREDNFPTVNMEALACGTPVITFNTGGSPEIIDESCGIVIKDESMDQLIIELNSINKKTKETVFACTKRAENFNKKDKFESYIRLYLGEKV